MNDLYAKNEKALWELHEQIVNDIIVVLEEKGYHIGDKVNPLYHNDDFVIMRDRLLINETHTDRITVDNLLKHLRDAYRVLPNES